MKHFIHLLIILFLFTSLSFAENSLEIRNPRNDVKRWPGVIEEAIYSVKPNGVYMEVGIFLTLSADEVASSHGRMEIIYKFELPEEAIVTDSWLWIGRNIIRGELWDKDIADSTYTGIVNQQYDPSILTKLTPTQYELRIFPVTYTKSRKIKLTVLLPASWYENQVTCTLPVDILNVTKRPVSKFHILSWEKNGWSDSQLLEFPNKPFQKHTDPTLGAYKRVDIPASAISTPITYMIKPPYHNNIYFNFSQSGVDKYFQMVLLPHTVISGNKPTKNIAFMLDHGADVISFERPKVLNYIKDVLHMHFSPTDSFNIIFSDTVVNRLSNDWIPANASSIENAFSQIDPSRFKEFTNVQKLVENGIDFVNNKAGHLFLVSANKEYQLPYNVIGIVDSLFKHFDPVRPIHVLDYNYKLGPYTTYWPIQRGNEDYFKQLTSRSNGYYARAFGEYSFYNKLSEVVTSVHTFKSFSFDLSSSDQVDMESKILLDTTKAYLGKPIISHGKYTGQFPFTIHVKAEYEQEIIDKKIEIDYSQVQNAGDAGKQFYGGRELFFLQPLSYETEISNDEKQKINSISKDHRALSYYTAFLCLEPNRGGKICKSCVDETKLVTGINDQISAQSDSLITAYPNPFNNQTTIKLNLPVNTSLKDVQFVIYNIKGQIVKRIKQYQKNQNTVTINWDTKNTFGNSLASGTYFFTAIGLKKPLVKKLLLLK